MGHIYLNIWNFFTGIKKDYMLFNWDLNFNFCSVFISKHNQYFELDNSSFLGDCPVYCTIFRNIFHFYPLGTNVSPFTVTVDMSLDISKYTLPSFPPCWASLNFELGLRPLLFHYNLYYPKLRFSCFNYTLGISII